VGRVSETPRPFPPGDYDVVVVGSGPGGLQTAYFLARLGVPHAVISADEAPGGMFRRWPIFQRLLSWSKPDAPFPRASREYEWYDHNSLVADEPELRGLVPAVMDRTWAVPSRPEMEEGLALFAERAGLAVRYGCRWEATRREDDGRLVLETSDGEYRCRAAVFAIGVTAPWKPPIPGLEDVPHYAETKDASAYANKRVIVVGKRNSAFEIAQGLLHWARRVTLVSPRPVDTSKLALSSVSARYLLPMEDSAVGGGTYIVDAAVERIGPSPEGFRVRAKGTTHPGDYDLQCGATIAATGFRTPLLDLETLGVRTVAQGRIPALSPLFESSGAPGIFFAGNASQGAPGLRKYGVGPVSAVVRGLRYNARILAEHLAERLIGYERPRRPVDADELVPFLAAELARAPELWTQKGYLCRVVGLDGPFDDGIQPLEHFLDAGGPDAVAVTVQLNAAGEIFPGVYLRRRGRIQEAELDPHPLNEFDGEPYRQELATLLGLS
jgi:thioredoxin reductase